MGDTETRVYQLIVDENDSNGMKIIKYFNMSGLGLCKKLDSFVANMFYAWSFSQNTSVPIDINQIKYFLRLNTYTTVLALVSGNANQNRT